ncbi:ABC transporter permease [Streptomyces sp. NPDC050560]|uniref:ABC transporter permease n=1 Tax=Streptomyces sp. NPDC050560 TaxID=3365630 RepID=UPI0037AA9D99
MSAAPEAGTAPGPRAPTPPGPAVPRTRRGHPLAALVARRLGAAVAVVLVVSVLVFLATELAPGDAATARLSRTGGGSPAQLAALRHTLGLDVPMANRYLRWLGDALRGDLGVSYAQGRAVTSVIGDRALNSLVLGVVSAVVLVPSALGLGLWSGRRAGRGADRAVSASVLVLVSVPEFVIGTLLVLCFATGLGWLPAVSALSAGQSPLGHPALLVLPVLTLVSSCLAQNVRIVRAATVRAERGDAVEAARLGGVPEWRVLLRWVVPAAVVPVIPVMARYVSYLLGGTLIAETLFGYPGLGALLVDASAGRDAPLVLAVSVLLTCVTVALNLVADVLSVLLNPARGSGT